MRAIAFRMRSSARLLLCILLGSISCESFHRGDRELTCYVRQIEQYRKKWQPRVPNMPERYARVHNDELYKFKATKLISAGIQRPDDMESLPSGADSESDDSFYDFTGDENQKKPLRKGQEKEDAFRRGQVCGVVSMSRLV